ncbi:MAG TPA: MerR family DNA-binding transcriptional regulator [Anaerolineae bacterium]|nr:MerR family DNA-binding transcriptional regulator [Anaerolineae bacterium]
MATEKQPWLTLREASKQIGVSPATLRAWADEGRVQTYRTPGGHRRFRVSESDAPMSGVRRRAETRWKLLEHSALGRVRLALEAESPDSPPLPSFTSQATAEYRELGRSLIQLLVKGLQKEQLDTERAGELGKAYAELDRQYGIALRDAVAGLAFFRTAFVESVVEFLFGLGEPSADQLILWLRRVNEIIDRVCLSMVEYHAENRVVNVSKK